MIRLFFNIWSSWFNQKNNKTRQTCHIRIEIINDRNVQLFYKRVNIVSINFYRKNNKSVSLYNKQNFWLQNKSHLAFYNVSVWKMKRCLLYVIVEAVSCPCWKWTATIWSEGLTKQWFSHKHCQPLLCYMSKTDHNIVLAFKKNSTI